MPEKTGGHLQHYGDADLPIAPNERIRITPISDWERKIASELDGHFCMDWDLLAISAWTVEYAYCACRLKTLRGRICNWLFMTYLKNWLPEYFNYKRRRCQRHEKRKHD